MLKYIISILGLLTFFTGNAQKKDSLPPALRPGVRLGYDVGKKLWALSKKGNVDEFQLTFNYRNHRLSVIYGKENMPYVHPRYVFRAQGNYFKAGYAYNFYDNWGDMRNDITLGVHLARASFGYMLQSAVRIPLSPVFSPEEIILNKSYTGLHATWIEAVSSVRAEIFKGLFLELHVSGKYYLSGTPPENFGLVYIPGFYTTNISRFGFGMGYRVSYLFQW